MNVIKLVFNHDLILDVNVNSSNIPDFTKPLITWSCFHISGTILSYETRYGFSLLPCYVLFLQSLSKYFTDNSSFINAIKNLEYGNTIKMSVLSNHAQVIIYKQRMKHGYDLILYSKHNIYDILIEVMLSVKNHDLRVYSGNGKRLLGYNKFHFEMKHNGKLPHSVQQIV